MTRQEVDGLRQDDSECTTGRIDRRHFLAAAGITTGAMWVAPTVRHIDQAWAASSLCPCDGGTPAALKFLSAQADTTPSPLPTACVDMAAYASTEPFCRVDPTEKIYLWGTGTGATNGGPMFDDMGIVTVVENSTNITRYGNIYRFQNYCRQGGSAVPATTDQVPGYDTNKQRVYSIANSMIWDFLPPAVTGNSAGATQTATPSSWWTASQPGNPNTQSSGNPGYTATAPSWNNPIDISVLFGDVCGDFTITVEDVNRYQQYKWSDIWIGTTPS